MELNISSNPNLFSEEPIPARGVCPRLMSNRYEHGYKGLTLINMDTRLAGLIKDAWENNKDLLVDHRILPKWGVIIVSSMDQLKILINLGLGLFSWYGMLGKIKYLSPYLTVSS